MSDDLKSKTVRGLKWGTVDSIFQQFFQAVFTISVGRMLCPEDYAPIGILTVFIALAVMLQEGGFGVALVQKKEITKEECTSVFYTSGIASIVIYTTLFFLSPCIADFYDKPILKDFSRFLFLSFVFAAFATVPYAILSRRLDYKSMALTSLIALIISGGLGIGFAFNGFGAWSLCIQAVAYHSVRCILLFVFARWLPQLRMTFKPIKELFSFSSKMLLSSTINAVVANLTPAIVGKSFDFNQAGLYTQASNWYRKPVAFFTTPITSLSIPVISSVNKDQERQRRIFRKMVRTIAFIAFPLTIFFVYISPEFVPLFIKKQWMDCVPYLQLLCLGAIFAPLETLFMNLVTSWGRSGLLFKFSLVKNIMILAAIFLSVQFGIIMLTISFGLVNYLFFFAGTIYTIRLLNYKLREFLKDTFLPFIVSVLIIAVAYPLLHSIKDLWLAFFIKGGTTVLLYLGVMYLAKSEIMMELVNSISKMKKKYLKKKI